MLRSTIYPIISRLSVDTLVGQMARFREDERFKAVGPDSIVLPFTTSALPSAKGSGSAEAEIWLDWAFVDFWKSNYCASSAPPFPNYSITEYRVTDTVQRGFSMEPDQQASSSGQSAESAMLISSLRDVIRQQATEMEGLQSRLKESAKPDNEVCHPFLGCLSCSLSNDT